jgi:hypothetical protein
VEYRSPHQPASAGLLDTTRDESTDPRSEDILERRPGPGSRPLAGRNLFLRLD